MSLHRHLGCFKLVSVKFRCISLLNKMLEIWVKCVWLIEWVSLLELHNRKLLERLVLRHGTDGIDCLCRNEVHAMLMLWIVHHLESYGFRGPNDVSLVTLVTGKNLRIGKLGSQVLIRFKTNCIILLSKLDNQVPYIRVYEYTYVFVCVNTYSKCG